MKKIILIGGGGHCRSCIDVIEKEKKFKVLGIVDNKKNILIKKYKLIGSDKDLNKISKKIKNAIITIGHIKNSDLRERLYKKLIKLKFNLPLVISPLAYVSKNALVGAGTIIMHRALININAKIGKNCIINTGAIIEHDVVIGDNCHISTGSIINGGVTIEKKSFIGSNAVVKQNIKIGKNSFVNANLFIKKKLHKNSVIK